MSPARRRCWLSGAGAGRSGAARRLSRQRRRRPHLQASWIRPSCAPICSTAPNGSRRTSFRPANWASPASAGAAAQQLPRHRDGQRPAGLSAVFYGAAAATADVGKIKAAMLIHFAAKDDGINGMWPAYEAALKAAGTVTGPHLSPAPSAASTTTRRRATAGRPPNLSPGIAPSGTSKASGLTAAAGASAAVLLPSLGCSSRLYRCPLLRHPRSHCCWLLPIFRSISPSQHAGRSEQTRR